MEAGLIDDFIRNVLSVPFCPYHFVQYHFVLVPYTLTRADGVCQEIRLMSRKI